MTDAQRAIVPIVSVIGAVLLAFLVATVVGALVRSAARRSPVAADLSRRSRRPLRAVLVVTAVALALRASTVGLDDWQGSAWKSVVDHALLIAVIAAVTWLVGTLAFVFEDAALSRYRTDVKDNRHARRVRTQVQLLRRITVAVLVVVAVASVLLTFPGVSRLGTSILASAGVLSVVAGLAAQSSLANVFAGLQIAFTDGIRVDDVVIVEQEWGRIEEITLTYVVVHIWDDRRMILPSTYFTSTPFQNWTRRAAELLGTVELDVDWQVPVVEMRQEFNRLLDETDLWDRRVGVLQVTDAVGGYVRLRALASAVDAPTLFDLRCYVREGLVAWLQSTAPQGLPRTRIETGAPGPASGGAVGDRAVPHGEPAVGAGAARAAAPDATRPATTSSGPTGAQPHDTQRIPSGQLDARLFTGTIDAIERSRSFTGPGAAVIDEREETAARDAGPDRRDDVDAEAGPADEEPGDGRGVEPADDVAVPAGTEDVSMPADAPHPVVPPTTPPAGAPTTSTPTTSTPTTRVPVADPPTAVVPTIDPEEAPDPDAADQGPAGPAPADPRHGPMGAARPSGPTRSSGHVPARRRGGSQSDPDEDPDAPDGRA